MRAAFLCRRFTVLTISVFFYEKAMNHFIFFTLCQIVQYWYLWSSLITSFLRKKVNILKLRSQVIDIFINQLGVLNSESRG